MNFNEIRTDQTALANWFEGQKAAQARRCRILLRRKYADWRLRKYEPLRAVLILNHMDQAYRQLAKEYLRGSP